MVGEATPRPDENQAGTKHLLDSFSKTATASLSVAAKFARVRSSPESFVDLGLTVLAGAPADFGKLIAVDTEKWGKVVRAAGIKVE
jgi:hypothetical protein